MEQSVEIKGTLSILQDSPATSDEFESGGHKRSAMALASAIRELADRDGAIGVQGGWGSGKSSVINFAEDMLEPENKTDVRFSIFSFDLWSHQTDDFKRSLLEEIIQWATRQKLIKSKTADNLTDRIRDKKKTITYENKKTYNLFGSLLILILPLLPLIYTWLSPFAFGNSVFPGATDNLVSTGVGEVTGDGSGLFERFRLPHWAAFIGATGIYLSVLFLFLKNLVDGEGPSKAFSKAVSLFNRDVDKETITQNIRDEEPTSVEFQNLFREFLSAVQNSKRKLVIVIDNIDRLPVERARDVWAEARSVFALNLAKNKLENSTVTVVIPYDEEYVSKSFVKTNSDSQSSLREDTRDLIQKTFNVVIRVSPPLAADWRKFFSDKSEEIFGKLASEDDIYRLFKILDIHLQNKEIYPTPRYIISFINEISVLLSQWQDEVPIECIGLYVLHREAIENHPEKLRDPDLVSERFLRAIREVDWRKYLACLFFNVSASDANQVLLSSSIAAAISAGNKEKYKELCGIRGFPEVLPDVLELHGINWAKEDAQTFSKVASCLSSQELRSSTSSHIWSQMAEFLRYLKRTEISEIRTEDYSGLFDTLRHQSREQDIVAVARSLLLWLNRSVTQAGDGADKLTVSQGEAWGEFAIAVWQIVSNSATEVVAADLIKSARVPTGVNFSLGILGKTLACKGFPHDSVELSTDTATVLNALPEIMKQELSCFCSVVANGSRLLNENNARKCLDKIATVLNDQIDQVEAGKLLDVVPYLRSCLDATAFKDSMSVALDSGALAHQWSSSEKKSNAKMSGLLKWVAVEARDAGIKLPTDIPTHPKLGDISSSVTSFNKSFDETDIKKEELVSVCGAIELTSGFTRWQGYALTERRWFVEVFRELVSRAKYLSVSVSDYIEKYEKTKKLVGDELAKQYLAHFAAWEYLFSENFSGKNSLKVAPAAIVDIHKFQISELSSLCDSIDKYLASLDAEEWFDKLSSGGQELDALCARLEVGGNLPPPGAFRPAMFEYCKQILSGERTGVQGTQVSHCALSLSSASRKKIAKDLLVFMKDHNITTENAVGIVLEFPSISNEISFEHDPEAALDMFVLPLMSSPDEAVYQFLKRRVSDVETACQLASSEVVERVKETMDGIDSKAEEDLSPLEIFYKERLKL